MGSCQLVCRKQNEVTKKAEEWAFLGSIAGAEWFLCDHHLHFFFHQKFHLFPYFWARRGSLRPGSINMCHYEAHFILSAHKFMVALGLVKGHWEHVV